MAFAIAITHGRAIWHEQQQQQHEHELAADHYHYSCTPALHASPLYACPLSQRLLSLAPPPRTKAASAATSSPAADGVQTPA
jgi:hypothetical protein